MFPLKANEPYIKETGERSTLGAELEAGGGGGAALPDYDEGDAGKVLGVDEEGLLEWKELGGGTKIYYKDLSLDWSANVQFASFDGSAAAASGYFAARPLGTGAIDISGYTPINAFAIDKYTGYYFGVLIEKMGNSHRISFAISSRGIDKDSCGVRVFYVKNEDLAQLT